MTRRDQDHRYPLRDSHVENLDTLEKIQVKRHAPPPGELVWAAEMTKMPAPGSGTARALRFQKNERRMIA
ncbi:hypothetical protein RL4645 [Rhizobium johnstonii 3841]|uniref:Uncharacterized protein n=1 Tax=Rhizobium johnstonii (strain DSM 114642 / LMG 32736 / 3841) TaxID=216596 RepID=Q1MAB1_RHIJ3|nr:hypothetical protein RL4645 [Rhizobium johnstonii 3841]